MNICLYMLVRFTKKTHKCQPVGGAREIATVIRIRHQGNMNVCTHFELIPPVDTYLCLDQRGGLTLNFF